jgi:hypothetical protein
MTDQNTDAAPAAAETSPAAPAAAVNEAFSVRDAAAALTEERRRRAAPAEPESASGPEADAAPPQEAPGETDAPDPALREPSIEPPRSWTKDAKEAFKSLPPEHQRWLAEQADSQEKDFRRRQNDVAEQSKALQAHALQAQQARQQYEYVLTQSLQALQAAHQGEFADIRTQQDVDRLASDDPLRYIRWKASRDKIAGAEMARAQAEHRAYQEQLQRWSAFTQAEDAKLQAEIPDLKDPVRGAALQAKFRQFLGDRGFSGQELARFATLGDFRDARVQLILYDAMRYREAQAKLDKAKAAEKPAPHVQRPGVAASRPDTPTAKIQELNRNLDRTGSIRAAAALLSAERHAAQRRAARTP